MFAAIVLTLGWTAPFQEGGQPAPPPKAEAKLSLPGKYLISGRRVKLAATLPTPAAAQAADAIEVHSKAGEKPVHSQPMGPGVATEAASGGGQKRTGDWTVPDLPAGQAEVFWKCGEQVAGPATTTILKPVTDVDWEKVDASALSKAAVLIETDYGQMLVEFYPDKAPATVRNYLKLCAKGFYDGLTFHRILENFMIQGGDPTGTGTGDAGYKIKAEFNDAKHVKGVISMARSKAGPDTAGSQFFILHADKYPSLDGHYTAFGKLMDGYDTLDKIATVPTDVDSSRQKSKPRNKVYMRRVTVIEKPAG